MADALVTIADSRAAVEALRPVWEAAPAADIDSDIDYFLAVAENAEQVVSPHVVRIRRAGLPDILVVARLENLPVRLQLAYWTFARVRLRAIVVTFGGVIGTRGAEDEALVMRELRRLLDAGAADLLLMRNVDPRGTLHDAARRIAAGIRRAHAQPVDHLWAMSLPATLDALLAGRSAKSRSSFRREDRLLREEFGNRLTLRRFQRPDELDELCRDMERVSARTYQAGLGAGFANSPMERALVSLGLAKGRYRCWMLYAGERPIAFWAGAAHGGTFFPGTPGFDPDHARHSIGRYTMFRMIEDLCADPAVSRIDFGRGDAQYKTEYAAVTRQATDVWLAARRPWPVAVVGLLSLAGLANRHGRRWSESLDLSRRLKALWRRRLAGRSQNRAAAPLSDVSHTPD